MNDGYLMILRASIALAVAGLGVYGLLRLRPIANPIWHRIAWSVVLLQGIMLVPVSLSIPLPSFLVATYGVPTDRTSEPSELNPHTLSMSHVENQALDTTFYHVSKSQEPSILHLNEKVSTDAVASNASIHESDVSSFNSKRTLAELNIAPHVPNDSGNLTLKVSSIIGIVWAAGSVSYLLLLCVNYVRLQRSLSDCRPARPRWAEELSRLAVELDVRDSVRLDVHNSLGPFLCWTPRGHRIVVPVRLWNHLSHEERLAVLHHELCHLRRGDLWKAMCARVIVALHWFNPIAWFSVRKFDESAEWSCDAQLSQEAPTRITKLASALLVASQTSSRSPVFSAAVTGGALFQRVRRLVADATKNDTRTRKCLWITVLIAMVIASTVRLEWQMKPAFAQDTASSSDSAASAESTSVISVDNASTALTDYASRILIADNDQLKSFVALLHQQTGQIIMADRAALAAENALNNLDVGGEWQRFVNTHFDLDNQKWVLKPESKALFADLLTSVQKGQDYLSEIVGVFQKTANQLDSKHELSAVLKRFLQHEEIPGIVYHWELRESLHPDVEQIHDAFGDQIVRTNDGYVIRPTKRKQLEDLLARFIAVKAPLLRLENELAAWSEDISKTDEVHQEFAATIKLPAFAKYFVVNSIRDESPVSDEELSYVFELLEDATKDTASGLVLALESDQYREFQDNIDRFNALWQLREKVLPPLHKFAEQIVAQDDLHKKLKDFLQSEFAFLYVAASIDYLPESAEEAANTWLSSIVTDSGSGTFEITADSAEDLNYRMEEYFREFRDLRRRGRVMDEFALDCMDADLRRAIETTLGKLQLISLMETTMSRPKVDGLSTWFLDHFEETPEGLVLHDWAGEVIQSILDEAKELESELSNQDF